MVTVLDGTVGGSGPAPETARRMAAARAVADAADVTNATLLGVADGAPVAAALAASGSERIGRLVLFDVFSGNRRDSWGRAPSSGVTARRGRHRLISSFSFATRSRRSVGSAASGTRFARRSRRIRRCARSRSQRMPSRRSSGLGRRTAGRAASPACWATSHSWRDLPRERQPPRSPRSGSPSLCSKPGPMRLESGAEEQLGLEIASRIPGSRHRTVASASRWPWETPDVLPELLPGPCPGRAAIADHRRASGSHPGHSAVHRIVGSTERLTQMGDAAWRDLLAGTTRSCDRIWLGPAAARSTTPAMAFWPRSRCRRMPFAVPWPSGMTCRGSTWRSEPACTPASVSALARTWWASQSISVPASPHRRGPPDPCLCHRSRPDRWIGDQVGRARGRHPERGPRRVAPLSG